MGEIIIFLLEQGFFQNTVNRKLGAYLFGLQCVPTLLKKRTGENLRTSEEIGLKQITTR